MTERLTRRRFIQHSACASATVFASFVLARPAAAVIFPGGQTAVIGNNDGDSVRLRSAPSKNADVKAMIGTGAVVLITDGPKDADGVTWYQVQYSGQSGWIDADFITARKLTNYAAVTFTDGQGVRLRDNTDAGAKVVGMVPEGAIVLIVEGPKYEKDGTPWYHINHAGKHGFVMGTYLVPTDSPPDPNAAKKANDTPASQAPDVAKGDRVKVVNTDGAGVRMRDDIGYSGDVIAILEEGTVLTVTDKPTTDTKGNGWIAVSYDSTNGFVVGPYLAKTDAAATKKKALPAPVAPVAKPDSNTSNATTSSADKTTATTTAASAPASAPATATAIGGRIVAEAMKYIGSPYVWAGASPGGFDCSGFVMYIVQKVAGKNISHSIGAQASAGQNVSKDNLQPGDLVFFANTYTAGLSHAGIYIGGGRFIHAENEGTGVVISGINDGYYGPKFYSARRMS